jgi:hypothetical protein
MAKNSTSIEVQGTPIKVQSVDGNDYICLTDIAKSKNSEHPDDLIRNWLRNRNTLELLGIWERLHNPKFNPVEFDGIRKQAGLNSFTLTPKQWIERTSAVGIQSKAGRYGGTFAHSDIAFEFASWVSVEFKLYPIKDFQRLKDDENERLSLSWNLNRTLSKINYRIHTDAIKDQLIPTQVSKAQAAKQWRDTHPDLKGKLRDHASIEQLLVLANIESMNAECIHMRLSASERLLKLNRIAIRQMQSLTSNSTATKQLSSNE